jgi:molecular chaperone DnaJ
LMAKDYYKILGVERDAGRDEIKASFRRIARESHPDANPNNPEAEARFREAAEAYEVLRDPERRRHYDRGEPIDLSDLLGGFGGFEDILRSVFGDGGLFGGPGATTRGHRGNDILVRTTVSLEQAAFGCDVDIAYSAGFDCETCGGSGSDDGLLETCSTCGGAGQVRMARRSLVGTMMSVTDCPDCAGTGSRVLDPCTDCAGRGATVRQRTVTVEIPPGVSTGTRLRLTGRGESLGRMGRAGDLHVEVIVEEDPRFERHDTDLVHRIQVGMIAMTLGTTVKVPLLGGGFEDLVIPPGTQPGKMFTIEDEGVPNLGRRGRGALHVIAGVVIPTDITPDQADLLRAFDGSVEPTGI